MTQLKICGITLEEQAHQLAALGVDALGFNFWPHSKRYIEEQNARSFLKSISKVLRVGVFVNAPIEQIIGLHKDKMIDFAQLHGDEDASYQNKLIASNVPIIRVCRLKDREDLIPFQSLDDHSPLLVDAYTKDYGGSGSTFDWSIAADFVRENHKAKVILAGGITPENIKQAITQARPYMIDVASGAESQPGIKDLEKVKSMLQSIAETHLTETH